MSPDVLFTSVFPIFVVQSNIPIRSGYLPYLHIPPTRSPIHFHCIWNNWLANHTRLLYWKFTQIMTTFLQCGWMLALGHVGLLPVRKLEHRKMGKRRAIPIPIPVGISNVVSTLRCFYFITHSLSWCSVMRVLWYAQRRTWPEKVSK